MRAVHDPKKKKTRAKTGTQSLEERERAYRQKQREERRQHQAEIAPRYTSKQVAHKKRARLNTEAGY